MSTAHDELNQTIRKVEQMEQTLKAIVNLARRMGWNGVENSKILEVFLESAFDELVQENRELFAAEQRLLRENEELRERAVLRFCLPPEEN